jgi:hypothetical protein
LSCLCTHVFNTSAKIEVGHRFRHVETKEANEIENTQEQYWEQDKVRMFQEWESVIAIERDNEIVTQTDVV